jgi:outer membrane protein assembly factor BamB
MTMVARGTCARGAGARGGIGASALALSFAASLAAVLGGGGCDWRMSRGSPDGRGGTSETAIYVPDVDVLTHRWAAKAAGAITGAAATAGDTVYVGSSSGKLYAFDTASGKGCVQAPETCAPLWTAQTGGPIHGAPAIHGDLVYVGSGDGKLYAFDLAGERSCGGTPTECAPLWTGSTGAAIRSSPTIANGIVYVGSDDSRLYAFEAVPATPCPLGADGTGPTCSPKWAAATGGKIFSSPAVASGSVYVGSDDGSLYAFAAAPDPAACAPGTPLLCPARWTAPTGGPVASSPAVTATTVYVGSTDGKLYAFDAAGTEACGGSPVSCAPLWWAETGGPLYGSPAVSGGRVFIGSLDSKLYAFAATPTAPCGEGGCAPDWTARLGNVVTSSPIVAHGFVVVGSWDGDIYAFDAAGDGCDGEPRVCRPRWSASTGSAVVASPIVSYGRVIVGTADGVVHLWERPAGEWQQFRGGPSHQGITTTESAVGTTNVHELRPAWTGMTGASIFSSPAVVGGVVYVGSDDGRLYAFDAGATAGASCSGSPKACEPLWTAQPGGGGIVIAGSPAVVDGIVHVATSAFVHYGNVFAYDAAGVRNCAGTPKVCEPIWRARMSSFVDNAATVWRGVVYYADGYGKVAAFDAAGVKGCSGTPNVCQPLWTAQAGPGAHGSPTLYKGRVFVGSDNGNIYAFDANGVEACAGTPKVCEPLWVAETGQSSGIFATPAASDGVLYVASLAGPSYAFDANGLTRCGGTPRVCAPLWTAAGTTGAYGSPAVSSDRVFFTAGGRVLAFDKRGVEGCTTVNGTTTCSALWRTAPTPPGYHFTSPAIAGDVLYFGNPDKNLYAFDVTGKKNCAGTPKVCQPLASLPTGGSVWSSPAVAGGRVYVGSSDFKLWAFER